MKKKKHIIIIFLGLIFINISISKAQNTVLDSLYTLLKSKNIQDTTKLLVYNEIANELRYVNVDSSINLANSTLKSAKKINFLKAQIGAEYVIAIHQTYKSNYAEALKIYYKCLENLEIVRDDKQKARLLNNIGIVYYFQRKYDRAEAFLTQSLDINLKIKNYFEVTRCYNNLGRIYFDQQNYKIALDYAKKVLNTIEKYNIKGDLSVYFCNFAEYSMLLHQDAIAEEYALKTLDVAQKSNNIRMVIRANIILSGVYIDEEKLEKSTNLLKSAGEQLQKNKFPEEELLYLENVYKLNEKKKNFEQSFLFFKKYIAIRDSTQSLKNYKISLQQDFEYSNMLKEQQRKIERENEFWVRGLMFLGLALLLTLVFFVFRAFYIKSKTLVIISQQKNEIDSQKAIVEKTYQQLKDTADELDKSITYASRIQNLLLPVDVAIKAFFDDYFVIFKPKDKVSGDFYWFYQVNENKGVFVLGDCTGHGVSGAFMTMLSNALLYAAVHDKQVNSPADILEYLHESIYNILKQENGINGDGLDVACCMFDKNTTENEQLKVTFAGSKSSMYYVENGILHKKVGDKQRIGGKTYETLHFTNQVFYTEKDAFFYFTSDGFYDQNNAQRKKFGILTLQNLFTEIYQLPTNQQKTTLLNALQNHQANEQQRDDIALVGIKIN